jgi:hypothetical protein
LRGSSFQTKVAIAAIHGECIEIGAFVVPADSRELDTPKGRMMSGEGAWEPVVIADAAELRAFAASREFASRRPVVLELPGMSQPDAFSAGERINRNRADCGCSLGASMMFTGLVLALAVLTLRYGVLTTALLERLPLAIVTAMVFAALGKTGGVALGRHRARGEVMRVVEKFPRDLEV